MPDESALIQMLTSTLGTEHFEDIRDELPDDPGATWFSVRPLDGIRFYAVHHTGDGTTPRTYTRTIYNYHRQRFGGYGYHFTIYCYRSAPDRFWWKVRYTRSVFQMGANVKGKNDQVIGCVWVGDYVHNPPDAETVAAVQDVFLRLFRVLDEWLGFRPIVVGHRDLLQAGYTECPGDWAYGPGGVLQQLNLRGAAADADTAALREEIHRLEEENAALREQVEQLQAEKAALDARVEDLEQRIDAALTHAQAVVSSLSGQ